MSTPVLCAKDPKTASKAASVLQDGGLVVIPTETVYGIAAMANHGEAILRIYRIKGREAQKALLPHVSDLEMAQELGEVNSKARSLIAKFWPGPLTLIVPAKPCAAIHNAARGGLDTVALRCPDHDFTQKLIRRLNHPLVAPSANLAGEQPPTKIAQLSEHIFENVDMIIDGGTGSDGLSSTLLDLTCDSPRILRQGMLPRTQIEQVSGPVD